MKADVADGNSPPTLATEPSDKVPDEELGRKIKKPEDETEERERDIYSEAVVACKFLSP